MKEDFSRNGATAQRENVKSKIYVAPLRLGVRNLLIASLALVTTFPITAQTSTDRILSPPRKDLLPLHWPDLTNLEATVREQVSIAQDALIVAVKDHASSDSKLSEAYGNLGQVYHAYSFTAPARDCYVNAHLLASKDFRWNYLLAKLHHQEGRFEEAIRRYKIVRTLQPDYVATLVNLGNILLEVNRLEEATQNFRSALEIDKNNAAAHYGLGQIAMSMRQYAEAVKYFEQSLAQVPAANRIHYSLAMAYRGLGDAQKAKAHLTQQGSVGVRVTDPLFDGLRELITGERVHLSRGKIAFEAKRYAEAAVEFRKAVAASPDNFTARVNLGAALTQLGDRRGAGEQFEEAIRLDPGKASAHYNLAILLSGENKHDSAIAHLRSALTIDASDVSARQLLAQELMKSGQPQEALAEYTRVVQADPNNESAVLEQVKLLHATGQFKQALSALEKSYAQYPQKGRTAVMLAYLLVASPEFEFRNGARALDLAQRIYKASGAIQHGVLVAMAFAELGRCTEAAEWQRRLIAGAEQTGNANLLTKLNASLKLYEQGQPCRPPADATLADLP